MKVLVIEDSQRLREALVEYLKDEGYTVDSSPDGEEGLYKAKAWDYDVVVLDIMLPKLDGWAVLSGLRQCKQTPVIMLTARTHLDDRIKGLDAGADDYLIKPFAMEELVARIRVALRRSAGRSIAKVSVGDISIDTTGHLVYLAGTPVELVAREYAILKLLIDHKDRIVSRSMIYEQIFDENDESFSNMLDVYIYKLRSKFGKNRIKTKRGLGYMLVSELE